VLGAPSRRLALADEIERSEPKSIFSRSKVLRDQIDVVMLYLGLGKEGLDMAAKTSDQPNALVIFGGDIGLWNLSIYLRGAHEVGVRVRNS
jgi:hypothetical protein